jgi:hypothetical protein
MPADPPRDLTAKDIEEAAKYLIQLAVEWKHLEDAPSPQPFPDQGFNDLEATRAAWALRGIKEQLASVVTTLVKSRDARLRDAALSRSEADGLPAKLVDIAAQVRDLPQPDRDTQARRELRGAVWVLDEVVDDPVGTLLSAVTSGASTEAKMRSAIANAVGAAEGTARNVRDAASGRTPTSAIKSPDHVARLQMDTPARDEMVEYAIRALIETSAVRVQVLEAWKNRPKP